jgi:Protein of unknown function (DUF3455)
MFDISCLDGQNEFGLIPADSLGIWNNIADGNPFDGTLQNALQTQFNLNATCQHYFQSVNGALAPVFDCRSIGPFAGNSGAFVVAQKDKSIPSPDSPSTDVAWLELTAVEGALANTIYRINTAGGQPAASVSSSVDWCLSCSINVILFIVQPGRYRKFQVCRKILYVYMA